MIRDFLVVDASKTSDGAREAIGQRMLAAWPFLTADGTLEALSGLAATGGFWTVTVGDTSPSPWGQPGTRIRATRLGRRLVMVWMPGQSPD